MEGIRRQVFSFRAVQMPLIWIISSVGQSRRLITALSGVQVPDDPVKSNIRGSSYGKIF